MASVGSVDDMALWVTIDNEDKAEAILAAANTLVRSKTGRAWVDAAGAQLEDVDDEDFEAVKTVIIQVALRVWSNPLGITQESAGPYSRSVAAWAALGLSLTEDEKAMLPGTTERPKVWTLGTTRCDEGVTDRYLEVVGSELIPHVPVDEVNW